MGPPPGKDPKKPNSSGDGTGPSPIQTNLPPLEGPLTHGEDPASSPTVDPFDPPPPNFPEWSDADIAAEKWATKHSFEDPDFQLFYPRSLRKALDGYKRPSELSPDGGLTPIVAAPIATMEEYVRGRIAALPTTATTTSKGPLSPAPMGSLHPKQPGEGGAEGSTSLLAPALDETVKRVQTPPPPIVSIQPKAEDPATRPDTTQSSRPAISRGGSMMNMDAIKPGDTMDFDPQDSSTSEPSKLFSTNSHLLHSELMSQILCQFHFLFDQGKSLRATGQADEFSFLDNIYPKNKDGSLMYNPSGKYAVRLYWLGAWRKVIVDDRIPCNSEGKPLVVTSPNPVELWPILLTKAILKIAVYRYDLF